MQPDGERRRNCGNGFELKIEGAPSKGPARREGQSRAASPSPAQIALTTRAPDQAIEWPASRRARSASTIMRASPLSSTLGSQPSSFFALAGSPIR